MKKVLGRSAFLPWRFRRALRAGGLELRRGASLERLREFERTYSVSLPADLRRFYSSIDGMAEHDWGFTSNMRILPIAEVRQVREEFPHSDLGAPDQPAEGFVIADNSISAYFFAIDLRAAGHPVFLVHSEPVRVATGFTDFIGKVLAGSPALFRGEHAA